MREKFRSKTTFPLVINFTEYHFREVTKMILPFGGERKVYNGIYS